MNEIFCTQSKFDGYKLFIAAKFVSTLLPFLFYDQVQNYLSIILIINIMEAVILDYANDNHNNVVLGFILSCYTCYYDLNNNYNYIGFLLIYIPWNLLFCYKSCNFEYGLFHNIIPMIVSLFSNNMFIKWFHIRCLCIVVTILGYQVYYLNTKKILQN
jgi:hypothetical protein